MKETVELDETDRGILFVLQKDSRNYSNEQIADAVGVSSSTVSNRIKRMEDAGVIDGYGPQVSYDRANIPLHMLFICTVPPRERMNIAEKAIDVHGVVNVREFLMDDRNLHVEIVNDSYTSITEGVENLRDLGITFKESKMLHSIHYRPADNFGTDVVEDLPDPE